MDACGSPECRFLSGAQHMTETSLERLRPVTALMVKRACEYRRGGLLHLGHKQNGPLRYKRSNISEFIQIHNTSVNQPLQLPAALTPMGHAAQAAQAS